MFAIQKNLLCCLIYALIGLIFISCSSSGTGSHTNHNDSVVSAYDSSGGKSITYTNYKLPLSVDVYKFLKSKKIPYNMLLMHKLKEQGKY